jgi:hypothetical protein
MPEFKTEEEVQLSEMRTMAAAIMNVDVEYLEALEKLHEVCMKQNPYLN